MLLTLLILICTAPPAAAAGIKDAPVQIYQVPGQEMTLQEDAGLPAKYDPRTDAEAQNWFPQADRVEHQGYHTWLCWAFSATTAAELSWAKENYDDGQPLQNPPQLSTVHLAYYFYHWPDDPLGGTRGDRNDLTSGNDWVNEGGNQIWTMQHLANQADFVAEETMPFSLDSRSENYNGPRTFSPDRCYGQNSLILEDSEFHAGLPNDPDGRNTLKSMITKYGAVMGAVDYEKDSFMKNEVAHFNPTFTRPNHAVTIVGWDDGYDKNNFAAAPPGNELPSEDGAWLVQNSYGTGKNDGGFFWISYESIDLMSNNLVAVDMAPAGESGQTDLFQYDGSADNEAEMMEAGEIAANVFSVPAGRLSERLDRVGFTCFNEGPTDYTIEIRTGMTGAVAPGGLNSGTAPDGGALAAAQDVHTDVPGYHTFPLDTPVDLAAGEHFSVCVKFKDTTRFGVEKSGQYFTAALAPGQSFCLKKADGQWHDASSSDNRACFRIKAIAEPVMCQDHEWEFVRTVRPAKAVKGYDVVMCKHCFLTGTANEKPALKPVPNKTSLTKLVKAKKAMTVKWKKSTEKIAGKNIDGYQIRYSLKKTMKSAKTVTVKGYNVSSKKIKKLKAKKKYFVQIRTFKKTDGKMYYSGWSAKKAVKVK